MIGTPAKVVHCSHETSSIHRTQKQFQLNYYNYRQFNARLDFTETASLKAINCIPQHIELLICERL